MQQIQALDKVVKVLKAKIAVSEQHFNTLLQATDSALKVIIENNTI